MSPISNSEFSFLNFHSRLHLFLKTFQRTCTPNFTAFCYKCRFSHESVVVEGLGKLLFQNFNWNFKNADPTKALRQNLNCRPYQSTYAKSLKILCIDLWIFYNFHKKVELVPPTHFEHYIPYPTLCPTPSQINGRFLISYVLHQ